MSSITRSYIINNIKLPINASPKEAFSVAKAKLKKLGINASSVSLSIYRRSVDARNKSNIVFVYSVIASGELPSFDADRLKNIGITLCEDTTGLNIKFGDERLPERPVVVGTGPCGLFAALLLAENGYRPIVLERGASIADRKTAVLNFKNNGILDINTNIQFGAGGAGTFSDGKLVTRINDPLSSYVMNRFVDFGAPEEILYLAKPHIGTDILSSIIAEMLKRIEELDGTVYYKTKYIDSYTQNGVNYARTDKVDIPCSVILLAIGHSSRDTYNTLIEKNYAIEAKSFSVGMRIEHLSYDIDRAMYGKFAGNKNLGRAEYNLSYDTKNRGVYTFCMCPGGEVVPASSEEFGLVVNGMSEHRRDGCNSNSAVVCSIFKNDYGATPKSAIEFQRKIENDAFIAGGKNYSAPIITVGDFLSDNLKSEPTRILPTFRGGIFTKLAKPLDYLPDFVCKSIKNALIDFDKKIKGFASPDAILTGAETRTSAPVRILRNTETRLAIGNNYIYPCGEGAGYAGGITSAAIDGIKTALAVMKRFKP